MARHAGAAAPPPPNVQMTLALPAPERWEDESAWTPGLCWLCEANDVLVVWLGPVVLIGSYDRERAHAFACAPCLERLALLVARDLRERDGA